MPAEGGTWFDELIKDSARALAVVVFDFKPAILYSGTKENHEMSILTWLYLFCAFMLFESAITVYRLHRKAALNKAAGASLFLMSMYCLSYGLFLSAATALEAALIFRILWTVTFSAVAVMLHFCLMLARSVKILGSAPFMLVIYGIPFFLNLAMLLDLIGLVDFVKTPWGWDATDRWPVAATANVPYVFMLVYSVAGFAAIVMRSIATKDPTEKKQVASIAGFTSLSFACILIPYCIFLLAGWNPAKDKAILYGNLGVIFFLMVWLSGLRFTMKKYNLLVILPYEPV